MIFVVMWWIYFLIGMHVLSELGELNIVTVPLCILLVFYLAYKSADRIGD